MEKLVKEKKIFYFTDFSEIFELLYPVETVKMYSCCNIDMPIYVTLAIISFFVENVVLIAISELEPA